MSNEPQPQHPASDPAPGEASVLDLFKSVTRDWPSFIRFLRSLRDSGQRLEIRRVMAEETHLQDDLEPVTEPSAPGAFPWRSLFGLTLALGAQSLLELPNTKMELVVALYLFAAILIVWAFIKDEWHFAPARREVLRGDPLTVRSIPLFLSIVFALWAFYLFGEGVFTLLNVAVWIFALVSFAWAVWMPRTRLRSAVNDPDARRQRILWIAVFTAVFGLMIFFRLNQIDGIPAEPFSDHAEKILDVYDVSQGETRIFFPRNSGREAIQMYWTLLVSWIFGTGLSFLSLKIGTVLLGLLALPYIYLLGKEIGSPRVGMLAMFLFGIAYWQNVISRMGLRFPLYPLFAAPVLFYLLRGLRLHARNDFLFCGLFIGLGLHGYSPFRIVPFVVLAAFGIYLLNKKSPEERRQALWWLTLVGVTSLLVFLPLLRYALDHPTEFSYRAFSRLGDIEQPLPGPAWQIFLSNMWNALRMFNVNDGQIWVNSLPDRPALDVVTGALFVLGIVLLTARIVRRRDWRDGFLLLSIPMLLLPSVLSLAYPDENPALNRAGAAAVPAILIAALALDGLLAGLMGPAERSRATEGVEAARAAEGVEASGKMRTWLAWGLTGMLLAASAYQNYDLVFRQFNQRFRAGALNTSEMGQVISDFRADYGQTDTVWIVPFPHWVDTHLPGVWAGIPNRDFAIFREDLPKTLDTPYPKLFMFWPDDLETQQALEALYPNGVLSRYTSATPNKDFSIFFVEK